MAGITHADTYTHFVGSGALSYPWYTTVSMTPDDWTLPDSAYQDWCLEWTDPDSGQRHRVTHDDILRAARLFAGAMPPVHATSAAVRECRNLLHRPDEVDFDANSADEVIQVAGLGQIVYA